MAPDPSTSLALSEAVSIVREADPDRYLADLYAPADRRDVLFALHAFNAEIAAIRDRVSQPLPGEVRLQWWRDVLSAGDPAAAGGHPLAVALLEIIRRYRLPVEAFENMLDARIFDLYDDPMPSRNDLEGYCGETAGALIQLGALVLDDQAAARMAALAGHAGCAQAMTGILRLLPIHLRRGQCFIPQDMLQAVGVTREELLSDEAGDGGKRAVTALAALAREHLTAFRGAAADLPQSLRAAYLPLSLTAAYLNRIEDNRSDPLHESIGISSLRRHLLMFRRAVRGW